MFMTPTLQETDYDVHTSQGEQKFEKDSLQETKNLHRNFSEKIFDFLKARPFYLVEAGGESLPFALTDVRKHPTFEALSQRFLSRYEYPEIHPYFGITDLQVHFKKASYEHRVPKNYRNNRFAIKAVAQAWKNVQDEARNRTGKATPPQLNSILFAQSVVDAGWGIGIHEDNFYIYDYDQSRYFLGGDTHGQDIIAGIYTKLIRDEWQDSNYDEQKVLRALRSQASENGVLFTPLQRWELPCRNGILNLFTRHSEPYSPLRLVTSYIDTDYIEGEIVREEQIRTFIDDVFSEFAGGNEERVQNLWTVAIATVLGHIPGKGFIVLIGKAGTGKSSFLNLLTRILGKNNVSGVPLDQFSDENKLGDAIGKRANISEDMSANAYIKDDGNLRKVAVGEPVTLNRKYLSALKTTLSAIVIQGVNRLPIDPESSGALERRAMMVTFENLNGNLGRGKYSSEVFEDFIQRDPLVPQVLLKMIIEKCQGELYDSVTGLDHEAYRKEMEKTDSVTRFIEEKSAEDFFSRQDLPYLSVDVLYNVYLQWCADGGIKNSVSKETFMERIVEPLRAFGFERNIDSRSRKRLVTLSNLDGGSKVFEAFEEHLEKKFTDPESEKYMLKSSSKGYYFSRTGEIVKSSQGATNTRRRKAKKVNLWGYLALDTFLKNDLQNFPRAYQDIVKNQEISPVELSVVLPGKSEEIDEFAEAKKNLKASLEDKSLRHDVLFALQTVSLGHPDLMKFMTQVKMIAQAKKVSIEGKFDPKSEKYLERNRATCLDILSRIYIAQDVEPSDRSLTKLLEEAFLDNEEEAMEEVFHLFKSLNEEYWEEHENKSFIDYPQDKQDISEEITRSLYKIGKIMKSQEIITKSSYGELLCHNQHPLSFDIESDVIWGVDEAAEELVENPVRVWLTDRFGTLGLWMLSLAIKSYLKDRLQEIAEEREESNSEAA